MSDVVKSNQVQLEDALDRFICQRTRDPAETASTLLDLIEKAMLERDGLARLQSYALQKLRDDVERLKNQ